MRKKRLILAALVTLGMAPGTFVRPPLPPHDYSSPVKILPLQIVPVRVGPFALVEGWHLSSLNDHFGGYSALLARPDGMFLAASDTGRMMVFRRPDKPDSRQPQLNEISDFASRDKAQADIESLTQNRKSGRIWAGFEGPNAIERFDADLHLEKRLRIRAMRGWSRNSGPESLVRLNNGHFLVIEEGEYGDRPARHRALVFEGDPTRGAAPMQFVLAGMEGYRPVDATPISGGRALVLFRRLNLGLPPYFTTALGIVDPTQAKAGEELAITPLAMFGDAIPRDNYEGLAVTREVDGARYVWMISDDNFAAYQRTLLLKFRWDEEPLRQPQKARR